MNVCPLFLRRLTRLALFAAVFFMASGCETTKKEEEFDNKPLTFPAPKPVAGLGKGKWVPVPRQGGSEYVQVPGDDMEDVISFYGFAHPVDPAVKTFEDMEALMRADNTLGFRSLQRGDILGVPVLWFEKMAANKGSGSEAAAASLGVRPRQADGTYVVRTRGVFLLQKGKTPQFVTIACARTSTHGEIGTVYESQFRNWLSTIVANCFL